MDITDLLIDMDDGSPKFRLLCLMAYMHSVRLCYLDNVTKSQPGFFNPREM